MVVLFRYRADEGVGLGVSLDPFDENSPRYRLPFDSLGDLLTLSLADIRSAVREAENGTPLKHPFELLAPADGKMEVWASGVTYRRSRDARIEESVHSRIYADVYEAERPELFFKSVAWRVMTDGEPIGIRPDSTVNVPEPELAVLANSRGELVGYLVCNDVSSRSIEGANPLYLPQAKVYPGACAISNTIRPAWELDASDLGISCRITRGSAVVWQANTKTSQMIRRPDDLLDWLYRHNSFPSGAILSTGTGIVPGFDVTLIEGDAVEVAIEGVGTLRNVVTEAMSAFV